MNTKCNTYLLKLVHEATFLTASNLSTSCEFLVAYNSSVTVWQRSVVVSCNDIERKKYETSNLGVFNSVDGFKKRRKECTSVTS